MDGVAGDKYPHAIARQVAEHDRNDPHDDLVRQAAQLQARDLCEYCLHPTYGQFHIDHIIPAALWHDYTAGRLSGVAEPPSRRRGPDHLDNFAWACPFCNVAKSQHVAHRVGRQTIRLFDPRHDRWPDHFTFMNNYLFVVGVTAIGVATQQALRFNEDGIGGPLGTRHNTIVAGLYPPARIFRRDP